MAWQKNGKSYHSPLSISGAFALVLALPVLLGWSFAKTKIQVGKKTLTVEVADTVPSRERGLMFRKSLPKNQGMLFVFPDEQARAFWMKNTYIPLSVGFFDKQKRLKQIIKMQPVSIVEKNVPVYKSDVPAQYALEVNQGWFKTSGVKIGQTFKFKGHNQ